MNKQFYPLFPLDDECLWALGGDEQTLLLLRHRSVEIPGISSKPRWHVVQRCSDYPPSLIKSLQSRGIQLSDDSIAEIRAMPEDFSAIPLARTISVINEFG